jgi:hypothetical protein
MGCRPLRVKRIAVHLTAVGVLSVAHAATAAAEPPPPGDPSAPGGPVAPVVEPAPAAPPPGPAMGALGPLGAPLTPGGLDFLLGQYPVPSAPGAAPAALPDASVLDAGQFLNPKSYRVPTSDQVSPYPLAPGTPGPFARVDALKGTHAMVHGALGRMPLDQLSQPLPGTAPPAGTQIPVGPLQNLPDPSAPFVTVPPAAEPPPPAAPPG